MKLSPVIKSFLLYFISISALPGLVFWLFYQSDIKSHEHLFESQETAHVNLQSKIITSHFQNIESDLAIISELHELRKLTENHEDYSAKGLEDDLLSISLRKGIYDQIRFIGKTGQEILRVDYNKGKPLPAPKNRLQNKASRYYFKKTMDLNKEKVYVSPMDLNIEGEEVEKPFKPMIRFGTPIFNTKGEKQGALIINFMAQFIIDSFKNTGRDSLGQNHLLNSDGYWLSSPNPEDEWGFMLEERKNKAFSKTFSDEWTTILEEETGQFSTHKGLFTFTTLYPFMEAQKLKSVLDKSRRVSISRAKSDFWKIVSFVPHETFYQALKEESKNLQNALLMLYAFLVLPIGAGSFLFVKTSEQKIKAKKALKESEQRFRNIFNNSAIGISLLNKDWEYVDCNLEQCRMMGYSNEELRGKTPAVVSDPEYVDKNIKLFEELKEGKRESYEMEKRYIRKDGSVFYGKINVSLFENKADSSQYIIAMLEDITERKRTAEVLKESELNLNLAQKISKIGHWKLDTKTLEVTGSNELYQIFGLNPNEKSSLDDFVRIVHPEDIEYDLFHINRGIEKGIPWDIEHRLLPKENGALKYVNSKGEAVRDAQGNIVHLIGIVQDISERKKTEDIIKASLKEKEVLLQEIHHRVKNNMQVIMSMLRLHSRYLKNEEDIKVFQDSQDRIMSMALVHEKLYLSKDLAKIDFKDYASNLIKELFKSFNINENKVTIKVGAENVSIGVDTAIQCGLIINELVSNSIKYAFPEGRGGEIKVIMQFKKEDGFELIVSDNGISIPEDLDFKNSNSLGLQLVCSLAENQLKGKIELKRDAGTEFKIRFKDMK